MAPAGDRSAGQDQGQGDERQVKRCQVDDLGQPLERPQVRAVHDHDPRIGGQPRDELPAADVDGIDDARIPVEEHVGEATGARPGIEAGQPGRMDCRTRPGAAASFSPPRDAQRGPSTRTSGRSSATG